MQYRIYKKRFYFFIIQMIFTKIRCISSKYLQVTKMSLKFFRLLLRFRKNKTNFGAILMIHFQSNHSSERKIIQNSFESIKSSIVTRSLSDKNYHIVGNVDSLRKSCFGFLISKYHYRHQTLFSTGA